MMIQEQLEELCSDKVREKANQLLENDKVINVKRTGNKLVGEIKSSEGDNLHSCSVTDLGKFTCGCRGSAFSPDNLCSHVTAMLIEEGDVDFVHRFAQRMKGEKVDRVFTFQDTFETSLSGLNELMKGGIPRRSLFAVYGKYKAGKSIFAEQMAWEVMGETGGNALMFDTESDYLKPDAMPIWAKRFNDRFGLDVQIVQVTCKLVWENEGEEDATITDVELNYFPEDYDKDRQTVFVVDEGKFEVMIALHGKPVNPKVKGGKIDLYPMETDLYVFYVTQTQLGDFIEQNQVKFISYDSITRPLAQFHGGRLNYASRNEAENLWFSQIDELVRTYNLVTVSTHRQTKDPTSKWARASPKGGQGVKHWWKRMIHLRKVGKSVTRRLKVWRIPTEAEWNESDFESERRIYISDEGFKDEGK